MEKTPTQWMIAPLQKYADFKGRARRAEYWWYSLFAIIVVVIASIVDGMLGMRGSMGGIPGAGLGPLYGITALGLFIPSLAVAVRRLHDTDRSGWFYLIALIPLVGGIILLVWFCSTGTKGPNRFGNDPLSPDVAEVFS